MQSEGDRHPKHRTSHEAAGLHNVCGATDADPRCTESRKKMGLRAFASLLLLFVSIGSLTWNVPREEKEAVGPAPSFVRSTQSLLLPGGSEEMPSASQ